MRVGVTGAGGLLGSTLVPLWRRAGADVTAWSHRQLDVTDASAAAAVIGGAPVDVIVHCAAWTDVDGAESEPEGVWREPAYLVHTMEREEAISFGRVFRQNTILYAQNGRPELIVTDPTADDVGRTFQGNWRVRT